MSLDGEVSSSFPSSATEGPRLEVPLLQETLFLMLNTAPFPHPSVQPTGYPTIPCASLQPAHTIVSIPKASLVFPV